MKSRAQSTRPIRSPGPLLDAELIGVTALGLSSLFFSLSVWDLLLKIAVSAATLIYIVLKIGKLLRPNPYDDDRDQE